MPSESVDVRWSMFEAFEGAIALTGCIKMIVLVDSTSSGQASLRMSDNLDKVSDVMKDSRITVRLTAKLRRQLKDAARRSNTRESDIVRGAVERQLAADDEKVTAYQRAKEAGLIGAIRGAPRDLSTNPKRLDGFGRDG